VDHLFSSDLRSEGFRHVHSRSLFDAVDRRLYESRKRYDSACTSVGVPAAGVRNNSLLLITTDLLASLFDDRMVSGEDLEALVEALVGGLVPLFFGFALTGEAASRLKKS